MSKHDRPDYLVTYLVTPRYFDAPRENPLLFLQLLNQVCYCNTPVNCVEIQCGEHGEHQLAIVPS
jgi:hypothetical protein